MRFLKRNVSNLGLFLLSALIFCITVPAFADEEFAYYEDNDYMENEAEDEYTSQIWDPIESINRPISKFNDVVLEGALHIIDLYGDVVPQSVRTGIRSAIRNFSEPYYAANNIIEGDLDGVFASLARFTINTLAGFGGIIDVAGNNCLPYTPQGLSTTAGVYGVPPGPYLVLPFLGPSSLRHSAGMTAEFFSDEYISPDGIVLNQLHHPYKDPAYYSYQTLKIVDTLDSRKEAIRAGKDIAIDFYSFSKAAFYQIEGSKIKNAKYVWVADSSCDVTARKNRKDDF